MHAAWTTRGATGARPGHVTCIDQVQETLDLMGELQRHRERGLSRVRNGLCQIHAIRVCLCDSCGPRQL